MRSKGLSILLVTLGVLLLVAAAILFVVRQAQDKQRAAEIPSLVEKSKQLCRSDQRVLSKIALTAPWLPWRSTELM